MTPITIMVCFFFLRQEFLLLCQALNLQCRPVWPWNSQGFSSLCFPTSGLKGITLYLICEFIFWIIQAHIFLSLKMRQTRVDQVQTLEYLLDDQPLQILSSNYLHLWPEYLVSVSVEFTLLVLNSLCQVDLSLQAMVPWAHQNL